MSDSSESRKASRAIYSRVHSVLVAEYLSGLSISQLANKHSVPEPTMQCWLRRLKCPMRPAKCMGKDYNNGPATCGHGEAWLLGLCRNCYEKQLREKNKEYAERQRQNCREWGKKNRNRIYENTKRYKSSLAKEDKRNGYLRRVYGMTLQEYTTLHEQQRGVCAICGSSADGKLLHVDHCHTSGSVRGLLCFNCNYGLGWFKDSPALLQSALSYLQKPPYIVRTMKGQP